MSRRGAKTEIDAWYAHEHKHPKPRHRSTVNGYPCFAGRGHAQILVGLEAGERIAPIRWT